MVKLTNIHCVRYFFRSTPVRQTYGNPLAKMEKNRYNIYILKYGKGQILMGYKEEYQRWLDMFANDAETIAELQGGDVTVKTFPNEDAAKVYLMGKVTGGQLDMQRGLLLYTPAGAEIILLDE